MSEEESPLFEYESSTISNAKVAELKDSGFDNDFEVVLKTFNGRRFIYNLIYDFCQKDTDCFSGNSWTNFHLGQRSVGLILDKLVHDDHFEKWVLMHREAQSGTIDPDERKRLDNE